MSVKTYRVELSEDERRELEVIRDRGSLKAKIFMKALALLLCDEGHLGPALAGEAISRVVAMSSSSVMRLRQPCCETCPPGAMDPAPACRSSRGDRSHRKHLTHHRRTGFKKARSNPGGRRHGASRLPIPATMTNTCAREVLAASFSQCLISAAAMCSSARTDAGPPRIPPPALDHLAKHVLPEADKIILVMDNLNTHKEASSYEAFPPEKARE